MSYNYRNPLNLIVLSTILLITVSCSNQNKDQEQNTEQSGVKKEALQLKYASGIRAILEDSKGNIWFGSHQEGVALFDGENLVYYTKENGLSDNHVRSIYEDKDGLIWFECGEGLSNYDGHKIAPYTSRNYNFKEAWSKGENDLWFKGDQSNGFSQAEGHPGVFRYNGKELIYHSFPVQLKPGEENFYSVSTPFIKRANGVVWFGTYGAAIGYNETYFEIINDERLDLNTQKEFLHIRSIFEDSKGNLWIGNNGIGVFKYDGENIIPFTKLHNLKKEDTGGNSLEKIFSIGEDNDGNMWFGTYQSGVWRYDGESFTNYTDKDGLESNQIWTIYKSKAGALWFGGADPSGVYVFNGNSFERKF